jgi:hypothetical protein
MSWSSRFLVEFYKSALAPMTESRYSLRSTRHDAIRASQHASNYPGNLRALRALTSSILHAKRVQDSTEPQWILLRVSQNANLATLLIDNQQDLQVFTLQLALCRPRISAAKRDPVMPQQCNFSKSRGREVDRGYASVAQ